MVNNSTRIYEHDLRKYAIQQFLHILGEQFLKHPFIHGQRYVYKRGCQQPTCDPYRPPFRSR